MRGPVSSRGSRGSGFTLVELMVVLTIMVMLTALLLPTLARAREAAHRVSCLSRLRQLELGVMMYQHDFDHCFPQPFEDADLAATRGAAASGSALWFNAVDRYLGQSPLPYRHGVATARRYSAIKQDPVWETWGPRRRQTNRTLKMNGHFGRSVGWGFTRGPDLSEPARTVLLVDGRAEDVAPGAASIVNWFHSSEGTVGLRHDGAANVALADGHAALSRQPINPALVAPGWYVQGTGLQRLIWNFRP